MGSNSLIIDALFLIFAVLSSLTDMMYRKIFNSLTFPAMILGLTFNWIYYGPAGLKLSILGLLAGFAVSFVIYLLGGIGAGDVKFLAAMGSITGTKFMLEGAFYGVIIAAIYSIFILIQGKRLISTFKEIFTGIFLFFRHFRIEHLQIVGKKSEFIPYAAFLALGLIVRWVQKLI